MELSMQSAGYNRFVAYITSTLLFSNNGRPWPEDAKGIDLVRRG